MSPKVLVIRSIRKASYITNKLLRKGESFTAKVEDKATKILTGVDFTLPILEEIPFEKAYYGGIPYNIVPLNPALPAIGRKGKMTLFIPSLNKNSFFGGTSTALIIAARLSIKLNKKLRIVETLDAGGKAGLGDFFKKAGLGDIKEGDVELIDVSGRRFDVYGYIDIHPDDDFIASAWWDAHLLSQLPLPRKFIYLIQDYEPIFYSNSDKYLLAENTYKSERFIPLCNTKIMYEFMSERYPYIKDEGVYFEPAVSQLKSGKSIKNSKKKRLFLYGRPNVERNLFYTSLRALDYIFAGNELDVNEWELFMAGQDNVPDISLSGGISVHNLGKLSIDDYRKFARSIDVTVSLMMAPHPNYPTLELSSIGSAVVTTKYANKQSLGTYSKNILMADLNTNSIATHIIEAARMPYEERIANAKSSGIATDWESSLKIPLNDIIDRLMRSNSTL